MAATTFIAGVVSLKKAEPFQRVLWKALRGNVIIRTVSLPTGKEDEKKSAFIVFCHGRETTERIKRMCVAMGCKLVDVPEEHSNRSTRYSDLITKIDDIQSILYNSRQALKTELMKISEGLEGWLVGVRRDKAVYAVLNMFSTVSNSNTAEGATSPGVAPKGSGGLVGEAWVPTNQLAAVDEAVQRASSAAGLYAALPTIITPLSITGPSVGPVPTHFETTPLTRAFQEMTDAYGVPNYREINPALFMLASFPFLFAVMFGDVGHGAIMLAAGLFLCLFERQLAQKAAREEMFGMIFSGRYIIVLMGAASVFAGLVYNDFFARSLAIFPSAYTLDRRTGAVTRIWERVYPIGIDPIWNRASNALSITNSYKMKQSILLGLVQMTFGLFLSAANHLSNRDFLSLFGTFLPQLIFFSSLFGYLGFLILVKWIWPKDVSLIIVFINMALGFGKVEGETLFPGQAMVQLGLVCLAFACIPWMLLSRPGWMMWQKWKRRREGYQLTAQATPELNSTAVEKDNNVHEEHGEEGIGDCLMFSMIHTIEFILGSVSNTASYLRLWALSLAHAQLSEVLWEMILEKTMSNPLVLVPGFAAWFTLTVCIMVIMEGLSAFLHALRLHWVEFNGKFYGGSGVKFTPLDTNEDHIVSVLIEEGCL